MTWKNFLLCGITGWCMEIVFTSLRSLWNGDFMLMGHTSLWMLPIYGMAALILPVYEKIKKWPPIARGILYAFGIMVGEYISGSFLNLFGVCPWDYSNALFTIGGVVRPDYFPFWIVAGLVFERILCRQGILLSEHSIAH